MDKATPTDLELMHLIAQGQHSALRSLHDRHARRIHGLALARLQNLQDAQEVVTDTLVRIWQQAGRFDSSRFAVLPWLLGIARHLCLDKLRERARQPACEPLPDEHESESADDLADPQTQLIARAQLAHLQTCMERLSDLQREALYLSAIEGMALQQIADLTATAVGTVKTRIFHARKQLAHCLGHEKHAGAPA